MSLNLNAPVAVSLRQHHERLRRPGRRVKGQHADRGRAGRSIRSGARRPSRLGDRPVQPSLRLLHARRGHDLPAHDALLSFDEIVHVATVAASLGVTSLRLTGGEPLVRKGLVSLVARLSALGFDDLSLTTNGMLLSPLAASLAGAVSLA